MQTFKDKMSITVGGGMNCENGMVLQNVLPILQARCCKMFSLFSTFKGSVSQILRWVLLYINRKLSLRPIITSTKILSLLKGHFTINKKQSCAPLYCDIVSSRQY